MPHRRRQVPTERMGGYYREYDYADTGKILLMTLSRHWLHGSSCYKLPVTSIVITKSRRSGDLSEGGLAAGGV